MWLKSRTWIKLLPALVVVSLLFFGGIVLGILQSLGLWLNNDSPNLTFEAYITILNSNDFWISMIYSLRIVLIATFISCMLGLSFALFLYFLNLQSKWGHLGFWKHIWQGPFLIPHLVTAYMMVFLFIQSGWLARIGYSLGWLDQPNQFPIIVQDMFGWGIILSYTWKEAPFVVLLLLPILYRIDREWHEVARIHGASRLRFLTSIVMPLCIPPLLIAAFIIFAFMLSSYEIPYLLGVTYPKFISVYGIELFQSHLSEDRQAAIVVYLLNTVMTCILASLLYICNRRWVNMFWRSW